MPEVTKPKVLVAADYFIKKQGEDSADVTNKKLQKLLYYSQAWSLVLKNKPLFEEDIEAWVHGPAIPVVYEQFKNFGREKITEVTIDDSEFNQLEDADKEVMDLVWDIYGKYDGDYLELLSHNEEPWQKARGDVGPEEISRAIISHDMMRSYYAKKLKEATA